MDLIQIKTAIKVAPSLVHLLQFVDMALTKPTVILTVCRRIGICACACLEPALRRTQTPFGTYAPHSATMVPVQSELTTTTSAVVCAHQFYSASCRLPKVSFIPTLLLYWVQGQCHLHRPRPGRFLTYAGQH